MILTGEKLNEKLESLLIEDKERNSTNDYPEEVKTQSRRANSKWLRKILNSGRFNSMFRTINVITFLKDKTNSKEPIVVFDKTINFMRTLAFSESPGKVFLNNKELWETTSYDEFKKAILTNPKLNKEKGWINMINGFDGIISEELTIGETLRGEYGAIVNKYYERLKNSAPEVKKLQKMDNEFKPSVNQAGRILEKFGIRTPENDLYKTILSSYENDFKRIFGDLVSNGGIRSPRIIAFKKGVRKVKRIQNKINKFS